VRDDEHHTRLGELTAAASPGPMPLPPAERERALGLHEKGIEQLERGNVFAARRFF
jgi:hypothetical protein